MKRKFAYNPIDVKKDPYELNNIYENLTENVKKWWIWGYWISPLMYAQNAISVNEFLGDSWNKVKAIFRKV